MSAPAYPRPLWYADGLRWIGSLLLAGAARLERRAAQAHDVADPWPDLLPPHERVFELRTRIHHGL